MEDLIIRGGLVIDGSGAAGVRADVAVSGGRITGIGDYSGAAAGEILDAEGLAVAPGFIDAHAHSDTAFLPDSSGASKLYQGITTEISGNCGSSPFPYPPVSRNSRGRSRCFQRPDRKPRGLLCLCTRTRNRYKPVRHAL